jgi:ATP-dependent Clp protease adapter protein ClpS
MSDVHAEAGHLQVIFHDDDDTPMEFVVEVLHSVFKKPIADALKFTEAIDRNGRAMCGSYPRDVANEMLEAARQHIRASGHRLLITSEAVAEGGENDRCKLCGALSTRTALPLKGMETLICDGCRYEITSRLPEVVGNKQFDYACDALAWHFAGSRATSWSRPRASSQVICARTFRWPSTGCSRHRRSGFSASLSSTATRR